MWWRNFSNLVRKSGNTPVWLALLAGGLLIFLTARNAGMYPAVFADEWFYSLFSRLYNIEFAQRPSYLYFRLYGITNRCGDGFLECARLINALFFVASVPLIYSVARKYLSKGYALLVTTIAVFSPINSYTAYFMPESMYFFGFFLLTWIIVKGLEKRPWLMVICAGTTLACMSMVKVHAIFLFAGLWVAVFSSWLSERSSKTMGRAAAFALVSLVAFFIVRFVLGYLFAGDAGLSLLGQDYADTASSASGIDQALYLLPLVGYNLWGNLLAVAVIFGLPLALLLDIQLDKNWTHSSKQRDLHVLKLYLASLLFALLLITAIFFARVQGTSPYESISRLSLRYYDFLFPLMLIVAASCIESGSEGKPRSKRVALLFVVVATLAGYALATQLKGYTPGVADGPELRAFTYNNHVFTALGGLGLFCLILGIFKMQRGAALYVLVFLPLTTIASTYFVNKEMRLRLTPDIYDQAGQFTQRYLGEDTAKLAIVGADLSSIFRTHFYMKTQATTFINLANGQSIQEGAIPEDKEWLLLIGDYKHPFEVKEQIKIPVKSASPFIFPFADEVAADAPVDVYSLVRIASSLTIDFMRNADPQILMKTTGLSKPETIGQWSEGDEIRLQFAKKIPSTFELTLDALAFGPNVNRSFELHVGDRRYAFQLGAEPTIARISVDSGGDSNTMIIKIPQPTSPRETGLSSDERKLGLALRKITIRELRKSTR